MDIATLIRRKKRTHATAPTQRPVQSSEAQPTEYRYSHYCARLRGDAAFIPDQLARAIKEHSEQARTALEAGRLAEGQRQQNAWLQGTPSATGSLKSTGWLRALRLTRVAAGNYLKLSQKLTAATTREYNRIAAAQEKLAKSKRAELSKLGYTTETGLRTSSVWRCEEMIPLSQAKQRVEEIAQTANRFTAAQVAELDKEIGRLEARD